MTQYIVRGLSASGEEKFYTGRAGQGWLSGSKAEAFTYASQNVARNKAKGFNQMTPIHGMHFIAMCLDPLADSVVEWAEYQDAGGDGVTQSQANIAIIAREVYFDGKNTHGFVITQEFEQWMSVSGYVTPDQFVSWIAPTVERIHGEL